MFPTMPPAEGHHGPVDEDPAAGSDGTGNGVAATFGQDAGHQQHEEEEAMLDLMQVADPKDSTQICFFGLHFKQEAMDQTADCKHHEAQNGDQWR